MCLYSQMERRVPAELKNLFGEEVLDHTLVLLTCGDYLMGLRVEVIQMCVTVECWNVFGGLQFQLLQVRPKKKQILKAPFK